MPLEGAPDDAGGDEAQGVVSRRRGTWRPPERPRGPAEQQERCRPAEGRARGRCPLAGRAGRRRAPERREQGGAEGGQRRVRRRARRSPGRAPARGRGSGRAGPRTRRGTRRGRRRRSGGSVRLRRTAARLTGVSARGRACRGSAMPRQPRSTYMRGAEPEDRAHTVARRPGSPRRAGAATRPTG